MGVSQYNAGFEDVRVFFDERSKVGLELGAITLGVVNLGEPTDGLGKLRLLLQCRLVLFDSLVEIALAGVNLTTQVVAAWRTLGLPPQLGGQRLGTAPVFFQSPHLG